MSGAAVLAARSALRSGSGLVTVALPASLSPVIAAASPEATQLLLPEPGDVDYRERLAAALGENLERFDALAIGPGLGTSAGARHLVALLLETFGGPHLLDADALNLIAMHPEIAARREPRRVWTPHPGEFERLTGELPRGEAERRAAAERFVRARGGVIVLKGHRTVVADGERCFINRTGNPGMATGGAGDVLTGVIVSLLGQGFPPFEAAALGARLHGRAGDLAAAILGECSLVAGDIVEHLPAAIGENLEAAAPPEVPAAEEKP
jgi:NAD(P)H-hydrate epimerase